MSELKPCPSPIENAITVLENEKQCVLRQIKVGGCDRNCAKCDLVMKDSEILEGYDTAISTLRRAQPDNEPLTLEQLREMDGEPVWCADGEGHSCYCLVNAESEDCIDSECGAWCFEFYGMTGDGENGLHNVGWLAYAHKPGGEQT